MAQNKTESAPVESECVRVFVLPRGRYIVSHWRKGRVDVYLLEGGLEKFERRFGTRFLHICNFCAKNGWLDHQIVADIAATAERVGWRVEEPVWEFRSKYAYAAVPAGYVVAAFYRWRPRQPLDAVVLVGPAAFYEDKTGKLAGLYVGAVDGGAHHLVWRRKHNALEKACVRTIGGMCLLDAENKYYAIFKSEDEIRPLVLGEYWHSIGGPVAKPFKVYDPGEFMVPFGDVLAVIDATNAVAYIARDGWQTLKLL